MLSFPVPSKVPWGLVAGPWARGERSGPRTVSPSLWPGLGPPGHASPPVFRWLPSSTRPTAVVPAWPQTPVLTPALPFGSPPALLAPLRPLPLCPPFTKAQLLRRCSEPDPAAPHTFHPSVWMLTRASRGTGSGQPPGAAPAGAACPPCARPPLSLSVSSLRPPCPLSLVLSLCVPVCVCFLSLSLTTETGLIPSSSKWPHRGGDASGWDL